MAAATDVIDHTLPSLPKDVRPPITSYSPSMWGDTFTSFSLDDKVQEKYVETIEELKQEARSMLMSKGSTTIEKLVLIDTLERLGVGYHFEQEIEDQLREIFRFQSEDKDQGNYDLFTAALQFRVFRQHRYSVSCDVFNKFMGEGGEFEETLTSDTKGLLSLYEAANVRIHGEDILENAVVFTTHHLKCMVQQLEPRLQCQVKRALEQPLHRGVAKVEARHYISFYEKEESRNEMLLKLAKLDFSYSQNLYKKELHDLSRWWNELDLMSKLPHVRDRLVESYFWGMAFHFHPEHSYTRIAVTKSLIMLTVVDDTYDNYATLEEADLFTEILEKWDINEIGRLPDYMKIIYRFILNLFENYEIEAAKQGKLFAVSYAKEAVKQISKAYNKHMNWFMGGQMPAYEEYIANTVVTSCIYVFLIVGILGIKSTSKESIDWLMTDEPNKALIASTRVCRHADDVGSDERESKDGSMPTAVDCYVKQYGVSKEETMGKFNELFENAWKDFNTEWLIEISTTSKYMMEQLLNYARVAEVTYRDGRDGYTHPQKYLAAQIATVFVDPIVI
ncbi:gamma-cadinene synthase [Sesamum indicum]|uniref:Gamma-cadinene synthase n=1 Tax=Sesamum indicum TaxID=4182 RepID=A0A6I9T801_SESIN|nr:gamma-cadinene synthase [Sesamum indicum]